MGFRRLGVLAVLIGGILTVPLPATADFEAGSIAAHNGDHKTAMAEWLPLAKQGHVKAQYAVGALFAEGLGARQSLKKAFRWWRDAAEQNHAGAQYNIAVMYKDGLGVRKNSEEAVRWLNLAAKQGNTDAHTQLSRLYRDGDSVEPDPVQAYMWLEIAQRNGSRSVSRSLETAAADLSSAQLADANARVQAWMDANDLPKPP
ncbi:MAG: sel1 repeat family protein [Alphaproteobacteria bacterium]|nr:sel1 repeat family protein [Alphaproteobacteria bacterium]